MAFVNVYPSKKNRLDKARPLSCVVKEDASLDIPSDVIASWAKKSCKRCAGAGRVGKTVCGCAMRRFQFAHRGVFAEAREASL